METVIFGPGSIDQAHQPDEYLAADRIAAGGRRADAADREVCVHNAPTSAAPIDAAIIRRLCRLDEP